MSTVQVSLMASMFLLIVATILPLLRVEKWWIRIFDFPRMQILVAGLVVTAWFALEWEPTSWVQTTMLAGMFLCLVQQISMILPFSGFARKQVRNAGKTAPHRSLRIVISNVLISNRNSHKLVEIVHRLQPDLVLILEANQWWEKELRRLEDRYPYFLKEARENTYGIAFYSRLEVRDSKIEHLQKEDMPSVHTSVRLRSGEWIRFYGLHPDPPYPRYAEDTIQRDAELLTVGKIAQEHGGPVVVAGDLNDVAWSHTTTLFQKISGLLDPRIGRGPLNTFHAEWPPLRFPLDHVFVSNDFTLIDLRRLERIGSDHFPVFVHLQYEPAAQAQQPEPRPSDPEKKEVEQKLEKAEEVEERRG